MYVRSRFLRRAASCYAALLGITACAQSSPPSTQFPAPLHVVATVQDLMQSFIDPAADRLWDSVAYIATPSGVEDRKPRTDEDWQSVRMGAVELIEAANLLSMQGRIVTADLALNRAPNPGELSHVEMQQRIGASHDAFVQFARGLQEAALKALTAIDARDAQALLEAGGTIDQACEACHTTYWYPNQKP
jgi:hypothetical protein